MGGPDMRGTAQTMTEERSVDVSATGLPSGVRLAIAATLGLVVSVLTALVILGGIAAVVVSGPTLIRGALGGTTVEWAAPLSVWQWVIAGVIEWTLIAAAAIVWWAAFAVWRGQLSPDHKAPVGQHFALGAGVAMIAAAVLALVTHVRNWHEWHSLIAKHPEWGEIAQPWQVQVGGAVALLAVAEVVAAYGFLRRRMPGR